VKDKDEINEKVIWQPSETAPEWQKWVATFLNAVPLFFICIVTYYLLKYFDSNSELVNYRDAYLNLVIPSAVFGTVLLLAGTTIINWLNPWFSPAKLLSGDGYSKLSYAIIWGSTILALALVIASSN
jgi:magnesium-transporting ATPase (P-type)